MRNGMLIILMSFFSGCGVNYFHDTKTPAETEKEKQRCEYKADIATPPSGNAIADGMRMGRLIKQCMEIKGYYTEKKVVASKE